MSRASVWIKFVMLAIVLALTSILPSCEKKPDTEGSGASDEAASGVKKDVQQQSQSPAGKPWNEREMIEKKPVDLLGRPLQITLPRGYGYPTAREPYVFSLIWEDDSLPDVGRPEVLLRDASEITRQGNNFKDAKIPSLNEYLEKYPEDQTLKYLDSGEESGGFHETHENFIVDEYYYEFHRYFFDKISGFDCQFSVNGPKRLEGAALDSFIEQGKRICATVRFK